MQQLPCKRASVCLVPESCLAGLVRSLEGRPSLPARLQPLPAAAAGGKGGCASEQLARASWSGKLPHHRLRYVHPSLRPEGTILAEAEFCGHMPADAARWGTVETLQHPEGLMGLLLPTPLDVAPAGAACVYKLPTTARQIAGLSPGASCPQTGAARPDLRCRRARPKLLVRGTRTSTLRRRQNCTFVSGMGCQAGAHIATLHDGMDFPLDKQALSVPQTWLLDRSSRLRPLKAFTQHEGTTLSLPPPPGCAATPQCCAESDLVSTLHDMLDSQQHAAVKVAEQPPLPALPRIATPGSLVALPQPQRAGQTQASSPAGCTALTHDTGAQSPASPGPAGACMLLRHGAAALTARTNAAGHADPPCPPHVPRCAPTAFRHCSPRFIPGAAARSGAERPAHAEMASTA